MAPDDRRMNKTNNNNNKRTTEEDTLHSQISAKFELIVWNRKREREKNEQIYILILSKNCKDLLRFEMNMLGIYIHFSVYFFVYLCLLVRSASALMDLFYIFRSHNILRIQFQDESANNIHNRRVVQKKNNEKSEKAQKN